MPPGLHGLLQRSLTDCEAGWSMGSFGAIAEFHQDTGEPVEIDRPGMLVRATARGAIRIDPGSVAQIVPVAYETPSPKPHRWSHGIALCLPAEAARSSARSVLTELGPDAAAIRPGDAQAILFDMGLGLAPCDFCVRTSDAELLSALRAGAGRSLFEMGSPMSAILHKHPHRVAVTKLGRVEVYQKIGGPQTGGVSPPGPHTHVLPKLLASGRTHSANTPIPDGLAPCAYLHPGNPVIGPLGEDRRFDSRLHEDFQALLRLFGLAELMATKNRVLRAVEQGLEPDAIVVPDGRHHRAAVKVALRQLAWVHEGRGDAPLDRRLAQWQERFDQRLEPPADVTSDP